MKLIRPVLHSRGHMVGTGLQKQLVRSRYIVYPSVPKHLLQTPTTHVGLASLFAKQIAPSRAQSYSEPNRLILPREKDTTEFEMSSLALSKDIRFGLNCSK